MVRAVAHGRTGPSHRASSAGERDDLAHGVQDVCERLSASALSDRSHGRAFDLSNPELESLATRVLPHVRTVALLSRGKLKPESGCSGPSRRRKASWSESKVSWEVPSTNRSSLSRRLGDSTDRPNPPNRSEEHTSELQSLRHLVCRL